MVPQIIKNHQKSASEHGPFQTLVFDTIFSSKKPKIRWCGTLKTWFSHRGYCKNQDFHHSSNSAKINKITPKIMPKFIQNVTKIHAKTHPKTTLKTMLKNMHFGTQNGPKMMSKLV